jgi:hypothetical protein
VSTRLGLGILALSSEKACLYSQIMTMREGETVETQEEQTPERFVGYGPAAKYLGLKRNTLSSYVARGIGPTAEPEREAEGQYNLPVFTRENLDAWKRDRPGQGARTDLVSSAV